MIFQDDSHRLELANAVVELIGGNLADDLWLRGVSLCDVDRVCRARRNSLTRLVGQIRAASSSPFDRYEMARKRRARLTRVARVILQRLSPIKGRSIHRGRRIDVLAGLKV